MVCCCTAAVLQMSGLVLSSKLHAATVNGNSLAIRVYLFLRLLSVSDDNGGQRFTVRSQAGKLHKANLSSTPLGVAGFRFLQVRRERTQL
jgi:hypothetical protein